MYGYKNWICSSTCFPKIKHNLYITSFSTAAVHRLQNRLFDIQDIEVFFEYPSNSPVSKVSASMLASMLTSFSVTLTIYRILDCKIANF